MFWLLAFTLINLALTSSIIVVLARRSAAAPVIAPTTTPTTSPPSPLTPADAAALELPQVKVPAEACAHMNQMVDIGRFFQQILTSVDRQVADHSQRISVINREIEATTETSPDQQAILAAVAQIMSINNNLTTELGAARAELKKQRQELKNLVSEVRTDPLTGLANRRSLDEDLVRRLDEWRRNQTPLSLLFLDVDHFKQLNDEHGHQAGDVMLQEVARVLEVDLRDMDLAARYGGEEFAVLLPDTVLEDAEQVAERLRLAIAMASATHQTKKLQVTTSLGVTTAQPDDSQQSLIQRADAALYAAKNAGRNCTFRHTDGKVSKVNYKASVARHRFMKQVAIAPYRNQIPHEDDFQHYDCRDLSAGGLSFVANKAPATGMVVVEMEDRTGAHFVLARVVSAKNEGTNEEPSYRIGCSFQGRLGDGKLDMGGESFVETALGATRPEKCV
jgi:diguanylate cyclase (GGDEF)-like protein